MVLSQREEDFYVQELQQLLRDQGTQEQGFYHYDTSCTIENQVAMLREAGFWTIRQVWRQGNTTILVAAK